VRYVKFTKALTRKSLAGGNRAIRFSGRLGKKRLPAGRWRATIVATTRGVAPSVPRRASFTILAG
jgi:hypothetical protein